MKDRIGLAMVEKAEAEGKLEPGGTICFFRKVPSPDTARHDELMAMLHKISTRLAARSPSRGRGLGLRA